MFYVILLYLWLGHGIIYFTVLCIHSQPNHHILFTNIHLLHVLFHKHSIHHLNHSSGSGSTQSNSTNTSTPQPGSAPPPPQENPLGGNLEHLLGSLLGGAVAGGGQGPSITVTMPGVPTFIQGVTDFMQVNSLFWPYRLFSRFDYNTHRFQTLVP